MYFGNSSSQIPHLKNPKSSLNGSIPASILRYEFCLCLSTKWIFRSLNLSIVVSHSLQLTSVISALTKSLFAISLSAQLISASLRSLCILLLCARNFAGSAYGSSQYKQMKRFFFHLKGHILEFLRSIMAPSLRLKRLYSDFVVGCWDLISGPPKNDKIKVKLFKINRHHQ